MDVANSIVLVGDVNCSLEWLAPDCLITFLISKSVERVSFSRDVIMAFSVSIVNDKHYFIHRENRMRRV